MNFPYSTIISQDPDSRDFLLLRRPEIPITVGGPGREASYVGLVDTGSDNTIFPKSVADYLGILVQKTRGPAAHVFGGHRVELLTGQVSLKLELDGEVLRWRTEVCFYDFSIAEEETIILGHYGFLDFFTATFDGKVGTLSLTPNDEIPGE